MNRYPLWKNLLVFGIVLVATIVALPNVFGDDEAVQVSRTDGVADRCADARAGAHDVDGRAASNTCPPRSKDMSALVRLETVQQQERARDVLTKAMPNHVVALTLSPRTPGWLKALGLEPMLLGLDLRGGVHFLYRSTSTRPSGSTSRLTRPTCARSSASATSATTSASSARRSRSRSSSRPTWISAEEIIRALDSGDQLLQLGQLTSRLIVDRDQIDGRPGFNVQLTESAIRERQDFAIQQNR